MVHARPLLSTNTSSTSMSSCEGDCRHFNKEEANSKYHHHHHHHHHHHVCRSSRHGSALPKNQNVIPWWGKTSKVSCSDHDVLALSGCRQHRDPPKTTTTLTRTWNKLMGDWFRCGSSSATAVVLTTTASTEDAKSTYSSSLKANRTKEGKEEHKDNDGGYPTDPVSFGGANSATVGPKGCLKVRSLQESLSTSGVVHPYYDDNETKSDARQSNNNNNNSKSVGWATLQMRLYEAELGDNPSATMGPPITIQWEPYASSILSIDEYEHFYRRRRSPHQSEQETTGVTSSSSSLSEGAIRIQEGCKSNRSNHDCTVLLPASVREERLRQLGYSRRQLKEACEQVQQIQESRKKSAKRTLWERLQRQEHHCAQGDKERLQQQQQQQQQEQQSKGCTG